MHFKIEEHINTEVNCDAECPCDIRFAGPCYFLIKKMKVGKPPYSFQPLVRTSDTIFFKRYLYSWFQNYAEKDVVDFCVM